MTTKTVLQTFLTRFSLLVLNFALVIMSTRLWGSTGKGEISILLLNLSMLAFVTNLTSESSVAYYASRFPAGHLLATAYISSLLLSIAVPVIVVMAFKINFLYYFLALSVLSALFTVNLNYFIGRQNLGLYNAMSVLQLLLQILLLFLFYRGLDWHGLEIYFIAQCISYAVAFLISLIFIVKNYRLHHFYWKNELAYSMLDYGWRNQLSSFLQFLNYRLSYYFLEFFRGVQSVGVFSVGTAFSEAIWTVSRSFSLVIFSKVVDSNQVGNATTLQTKIAIKFTLYLSLLFLLAVLFVPSGFYTWLLGRDFSGTKRVILALSPGIIAIAVSNVVGYYFAGLRRFRILHYKSIAGLAVTIGASTMLISRFGILGACVGTSASYCMSALVLMVKFYSETDFKLSDFTFNKGELKHLSNILFKKNG